MDSWSIDDWERHLGDGRPVGRFSVSDIDGLPEPVQRYFRAAIALDTPMATTVSLEMRGRIKLGGWLPFRAQQVSNPHVGFIWSARAAGIISGYDRYRSGIGDMHWKLLGRFDLARGAGADVSRSAAGRGGAEAIWVPTALLPRFGVTWTAEDDQHITARHQLGTTPIATHLTIDATGAVRSVSFQRWGDPDTSGTWHWHSFGGEITGQRTFAGLTIPSRGRLGWHTDSTGRATKEFFRFEITSLRVPTVRVSSTSLTTDGRRA